MSIQESRILIAVAGVAGAISMSAGIVRADEPSTQDLREELDGLKAKIEHLESQQKEQEARLQTPQDEDASVGSVLDDAEKRSKWFQDDVAMTGGYDDGRFFLRSSDGNFYIQPTAQLQFRHVTSYRDDAGDGDSDTENGFEMRRAKFGIKGHAFKPELQYLLQWATDRNGGDVFLEDAIVKYDFQGDFEHFSLMAGQFKDPVFHEELVSSNRQLAVDRSLLNELLGGGPTDRVQGVAVIWDAADNLEVTGMFHDGYGSINTDFTEEGGSSAIGITPTNWGIAGRAEYLVYGDEGQYNDFSARGNKSDLLVVGAGGDWSQGGDGNVLFHTVDAQWENTQGLGLYGALIGVYRDSAELVAGENSSYDYGMLAQAGYMVNDKTEVFGRWNVTFLDEDLLAAGEDDTLNEFTIGANYFLYGHHAKLTVDLSYLPDGSPVNNSGIGVLATDDDEFVARVQLNLFL